jgi:hypothetical protein
VSGFSEQSGTGGEVTAASKSVGADQRDANGAKR